MFTNGHVLLAMIYLLLSYVGTALGLNEDVHKGLIDRFRSLPIARPAVLAGRTLADVVTNLLSIGVLVVTGVIIASGVS